MTPDEFITEFAIESESNFEFFWRETSKEYKPSTFRNLEF